MKIETKYDIGQHIWVVYKYREKISVYDDYIVEIGVAKDFIEYLSENHNGPFKEDEIIVYEDANKLVKKIKELLEAKDEEKKNN